VAEQLTSAGGRAEGAGASSPQRQLLNSWVALGLVAAVVVGVIFAIPGLKGVGTALGRADAGWVVLAVVLEILSDAGYALVMMVVFPRSPKGFVARLGWSESAFGTAVSVGGLGSLALGAWVLNAIGMRKSRIAERSAVLFLATSGVNVIVLGFTGIGVWLGILGGPSNPLLSVVPGAAGVLVVVVFVALPYLVARSPRLRASTGRWAKAVLGLADGVEGAEAVLRSTQWQTIGAWAYLLCDIGVLWVSLRALGQEPPFAAVVLAYQIGYLTNIIPIPGGVGVLDAGLLGMLVLCGIKPTPAAAAVLIYHAIALTVPLVIGTAAFVLVRRQMPTVAAMRLSDRIPTVDSSSQSASPGADDAVV
jgi:uncharacterized membrane protein YbhN (UPF0104 family)